MIKVDIVEVTGRTFESAKCLGMLPTSVPDSEFNLYVRWHEDGSVTVDRSDTDAWLVKSHTIRKGKAGAFAQLMESLATLYGMPVEVACDYGVSGGQTGKMVGTYQPRGAEPIPTPVDPEAVSLVIEVTPGAAEILAARKAGKVCHHCGRADTLGRDDQVTPFPHECVTEADLRKFGLTPTMAAPEATPVIDKAAVLAKPIDSLLNSGAVEPVPTVAVFTQDVAAVISVGDTVYREHDGRQGRVVDMDSDSVMVQFVNGSKWWHRIVDIIGDGFEFIPAATVDAWHADAMAEARTWAGTGTIVIKPSIRTKLAKRSRKSARRARRGCKGGVR